MGRVFFVTANWNVAENNHCAAGLDRGATDFLKAVQLEMNKGSLTRF